MCFRDWEDGIKQSKPTIYNEWRINNMSTKKWKNKELMENLSEKFGFKMDLGLLKEAKGKYDDGDGKDEKCDYVDCEGEGEPKPKDKKEESEEEPNKGKFKPKKGKLPPQFAKKKKKDMSESKLRSIIRKIILSEMKDKKKIHEEKQYSQNVLRSYQAFLSTYKGQDIPPEMEDMLKTLMSKYEQNLKGVKESIYNIENNLEKFEKEAFSKALDDLAEEISPMQFQRLAGFLGQTSTQPIPAPFPGDDSPQISNRDVSNVAEAFIGALKEFRQFQK